MKKEELSVYSCKSYPGWYRIANGNERSYARYNSKEACEKAIESAKCFVGGKAKFLI